VELREFICGRFSSDNGGCCGGGGGWWRWGMWRALMLGLGGEAVPFGEGWSSCGGVEGYWFCWNGWSF
jgi:hypothetical protein